jgi:hypothetical protein
VLPFTPEAFLGLFATYNQAIWPVQPVAYGLGVIAFVLAARPFRGGDRLVAAVLAAFWLWTGIVYHLLFFAGINFAAPAFAALFLLQGLLLLWTGLLRGRLQFRFRRTPRGWAGLTLALFALAGYPLLGWLLGREWSEAAAFGLTPCPTTLFTLGLLLLAERTPWHLLVIPVLWSLIGAGTAWLLEVREDLSLLPAALLTLALMFRSRRKRSL